MGSSGTLFPSSQPHGNGGSLQGAEILLRFRPIALLLRLYPDPVNRDPPPPTSRYNKINENGCVCGQVSCSHGLSLSLTTSSAVESDDSNLVGYLRFEFCDT